MSRVVSNKKQINRLIELMEADLDIARNVCLKANAQKAWQQITPELNMLGPPSREADKWQRVWNDLKFKVRKKVSEQKAETHGTGGGPKKIPKFTDVEEAIIRILKLDIPITSSSMSFGLTDVQDEFDNFMDTINANRESNTTIAEPCSIRTPLEIAEPCNSPVEIITRNKTTKTITDERILLLEKQTEEQKEFFESVKKDIKRLKNSIEKIEDYTRKTNYLQERQTKIKEEKLKLYKEYMLKEDQDRKVKLELKLKLLELEKEKQNLRLN